MSKHKSKLTNKKSRLRDFVPLVSTVSGNLQGAARDGSPAADGEAALAEAVNVQLQQRANTTGIEVAETVVVQTDTPSDSSTDSSSHSLPQTDASDTENTTETAADVKEHLETWLNDMAADTARQQAEIPKKGKKFRLQDALKFIRQNHFLIDEIPGQIDRSDVNAFLDRIARLSSGQLRHFTNELNSQQISLIYAAFTEPLYREEKQILKNMALYRASWYTFFVGWISWQHAFPNADMQATLSYVYKYLNNNETLSRPVFAADLLCDHCSLDLSDRVFMQQCVRLLEKELLIKPRFENVKAFFKHYAIQRRSQFAATLLSYFFLMLDWTWYVKEARLLFEHLPLMVPEIAAEILNRIIGRDDIPAKSRNFLFRRIDQVFVKDGLQHKVWQMLEPELKQRYLYWNIEDKITGHCLNNSLKRAFLLNYLHDILDVAGLNNDILALRFSTFVLIDDVNQPQKILYYDKNTMRSLLEKGLPETFLSSPPVAARLASDAVTNRSVKGIIELTLDSGNLKSSQMFMDMALDKLDTKSANGKPVLSNWVNDERLAPERT